MLQGKAAGPNVRKGLFPNGIYRTQRYPKGDIFPRETYASNVIANARFREYGPDVLIAGPFRFRVGRNIAIHQSAGDDRFQSVKERSVKERRLRRDEKQVGSFAMRKLQPLGAG